MSLGIAQSVLASMDRGDRCEAVNLDRTRLPASALHTRARKFAGAQLGERERVGAGRVFVALAFHARGNVVPLPPVDVGAGASSEESRRCVLQSSKCTMLLPDERKRKTF